MNKFLIVGFISVVFTCMLSSCYAFLKADKLVYAGTMAKRPVTVTVDSVYNVEVETSGIEQ